MLQTLCEAMQVCAELQQTVSSLDGRLAELMLWEVEARELYELIKEKSHKHQRAQNSRTRVFLSKNISKINIFICSNKFVSLILFLFPTL